jgi:hypothetical protein
MCIAHFTSAEVDFDLVVTDLQLPAYAAGMTAEFRLLEEDLDPQAIERVDAQSIIDAYEENVGGESLLTSPCHLHLRTWLQSPVTTQTATMTALTPSQSYVYCLWSLLIAYI